MKKTLKTVYALVLLSSVLGPAVKLPVSPYPLNIYLSDIAVSLLIIILLVDIKSVFPVIKNDRILKIVLIFSSFLFFTLLISPIKLNLYELLISSLYTVRFLFYFSIYVCTVYLIKSDKKAKTGIEKILNGAGLAFLVLGWLQYFLYPDLRNLFYLGWDPHYKRIFALIFDPNYLGLFLIYFIFLRLISFKNNPHNIFIIPVTLLTVAFTYSRSTYLTLFIASLYLFRKVNKLFPFLSVSVIFIILLIFLPRQGGASVQLERIFSISQRLDNWRSAGILIKRYPLFGVGFNTLRFARKQFPTLDQNWLTSHSAAGVDNSFLFITATSGLVGLTLFLYYLIVLYSKLNLLGRTVIVATVVHSMFLNSLFFSFLLIWLWSVCALSPVNNFKGNN